MVSKSASAESSLRPRRRQPTTDARTTRHSPSRSKAGHPLVTSSSRSEYGSRKSMPQVQRAARLSRTRLSPTDIEAKPSALSSSTHSRRSNSTRNVFATTVRAGDGPGRRRTQLRTRRHQHRCGHLVDGHHRRSTPCECHVCGPRDRRRRRNLLAGRFARAAVGLV